MTHVVKEARPAQPRPVPPACWTEVFNLTGRGPPSTDRAVYVATFVRPAGQC
jgi:hypothetical protein